MKISGSYLKIQYDKNKIKKLASLTDSIHMDVMDGKFVPRETMSFDEVKTITKYLKKGFDVHLMVKDVYKYIDMYKTISPRCIIFHYEAVKDVLHVIKYIKLFNIKVGIAINPETNVQLLKPYLDKIDLILVMLVIPGAGGQEFMDISYKVDYLSILREDNYYAYKIAVDGGINDETIEKIKNADIAVVGSFITDSDNMKAQVKKVRGAL